MRQKRLSNGYGPTVNDFNLCIIKDKIWKTKVGKGKGKEKQEGHMNYMFILKSRNDWYLDVLFRINGKKIKV